MVRGVAGILGWEEIVFSDLDLVRPFLVVCLSSSGLGLLPVWWWIFGLYWFLGVFQFSLGTWLFGLLRRRSGPAPLPQWLGEVRLFHLTLEASLELKHAGWMVLSFNRFEWVWLDVLSACLWRVPAVVYGFRRSLVWLLHLGLPLHGYSPVSLVSLGDGFQYGLCLFLDLVYGPVGTGLGIRQQSYGLPVLGGHRCEGGSRGSLTVFLPNVWSCSHPCPVRLAWSLR